MKTIQGLKIAAMIPLGFLALVFLIFGIGETSGGDLGGIMHLVQVLFVGLVIWLCWKRPLWGGILLLAWSLFQVIIFWLASASAPPSAVPSPAIIRFLPLALSGLLLLLAAWVARIQSAPKRGLDR